MPDISMCANDETCPLRATCYRSEASGTKPSERRQAYMNFAPGTDCINYLPTKEPADG